MTAAKAAVSQAQAEQNQAKMELLEGQKDLANAKLAACDAQLKQKQAETALEQAKKEHQDREAFLKKLEEALTKCWPAKREDEPWKTLFDNAKKDLDTAAKKISDATCAKADADVKNQAAATAATKAEGMIEERQRAQQKADAKFSGAIQSLLNSVQASPPAASPATQVAAASPDLLLLASALTPMYTGRWGTLYGAEYPLPPIRVPCLETPCRPEVPHVKATCGCATGLAIAGGLPPAIVPDAGVIDAPPAGWDAAPVGVSPPEGGPHPHRHHHSMKTEAVPTTIPAGDDGPSLQGPVAARERSGTGRFVRRVSYQAEEEPPPASGQPAAESTSTAISMTTTGPGLAPAARLPLHLPNTPDTYRQLRSFGAVATQPWPQPEGRPAAGSDGGGMASSRSDQVPHDPFTYQPRVDVIPIAPSRSANLVDQAGPGLSQYTGPTSIGTVGLPPDVDEIVDDPTGRVWTYHFDLPARFPRTAVGLGCCGFETEGAVIHEGMRLLARQDGQYEVRFNVTTPAMPVLLRMQLVLFESGALPPRTLTLPPIALKPWGDQPYPDRRTQPSIDPISYLVRVRGYSQVVREVKTRTNVGSGPKPDYFLLVKRMGSARFGSGFQSQPNPNP